MRYIVLTMPHSTTLSAIGSTLSANTHRVAVNVDEERLSAKEWQSFGPGVGISRDPGSVAFYEETLWTESERKAFKSLGPDPTCFLVDWDDIEDLRKAIIALRSLEGIAENDYRHRALLSDLAQRWQDNPSWNWAHYDPDREP